MAKEPGMRDLVERRLSFGTNSIGDLLINFFGFVAIGLLTRWCLSDGNALVVAARVCLMAECLQLFVEGRYASVSDLLLNVGGALAGAGIAATATGSWLDPNWHSRSRGERLTLPCRLAFSPDYEAYVCWFRASGPDRARPCTS
jgi:glycopeptide antibiotics resistance protein